MNIINKLPDDPSKNNFKRLTITSILATDMVRDTFIIFNKNKKTKKMKHNRLLTKFKKRVESS